MGNRVLVIQAENCTGCRMCELACSSIKEGEFIPERSRIRVVTNELEGWSRPTVCLQCMDPMCMEICPVGAIYKKQTSQGDFLVLVNQEKCTECQQCIEACPFGVIYFFKKSGVIKCDLCGGNPTCVNFCSYKCLHFVELTDEEYQNRIKKIKALSIKASKNIDKFNLYRRRVVYSLETSKISSISGKRTRNKKER
ncbi:MAG: 4Fe-4S dicluster domain-containing protein [Candidatus Hodarchaeota archaeon]